MFGGQLFGKVRGKMAQKSIKSFFCVQKKKVEEPKDNESEKEEIGDKKCDVAKGKPPPVSPVTNGKSAANDVASPIAISKRKQPRRLVMSSDEEENVSPSSSGKDGSDSNKSRSSSPEEGTRKARKKLVKGAAALKEIEAKRAAKKAKLENSTSSQAEEPEKKKAKVAEDSKDDLEVKPEVKTEEEVEEMEVDEVAASPEKTKVTTASPAKAGVKSTSPEKSKVKNASPAKSESEEKEADITSDFSDAEEKSAKVSDGESPPSKSKAAKGKTAAKPKATKKKSPAAPAKKTTPAATTKKTSPVASSAKTTPAATTTKTNAFASFFAPKGKKDGEGSAKAGGKEAVPEYMPGKAKYHPIDDATWERGKPVPYLALARTLECIEEISARLRMTEILSNFLRSVMVLSPDNLIPCLYLCLNKLAPAFEGLELGLAERSLMKAVAQSSGRSEKQVLEEVEQTGDLGIVAQNSCGRQAKLFHPPPLMVPYVFTQLKALAAMKGRESMSRKQDKVVSMYNACKPIEARYLIRSLTGKLRIGLAEQTVLQALALACVTTPPNQEFPPAIINAAHGISTEKFKERLDKQALILKTTYCECPVYEKVVPVLLEHGIEELPQRCQISPGVPLRPMLAQPTKGVADVLARFDGRKFTCEWKYDGERAQVHFQAKDQGVRIFSRNQEDNTSKFPEIVSRLASQLADHVNECILDCEAVGWDRENERILPFQVLSTRKKKDANEADIKVQVCLFVFDLLYINGESLVKAPLEERRKKLKEVVKVVPGQLQFAESLDTDSMDEVQAYLELSVKGNCEGLMVKTLAEEATYEIAKRSRNWLKLKKDYLDGVGDTLDLVVLGGYLGRGKRAGVYGGFLLGCYDPDTEQYQSICKIGTGFSDESLQSHSEHFKQHVLAGGARTYYHFDPSLEPDHWFDVVQVWEVKCADLSLSPVHKAAMGIVDAEKGISLRFPRFLRIRDDKKVEEATSAAQVAELYQNQEQVKNQSDNKTVNEEDFY